MLKLVLPKGSLEAQTLRLFEEADLRVRRGSDRDYHGAIDDDRIERVSILRPQEIPMYVQDGLFDVGITGQDWIAETGAEVEILTTLTYAKSGTGHGTSIVARGAQRTPREQREGDPAGDPHLDGVRAAHGAYFADLGIDVRVELVLRRDRGEGPRDRRRDRRRDRDRTGGLEQHGGHEHGRGAVVDRGGQPLGQRVDRGGRQPHHLDALLGEPGELAAQGVELAVRGDQRGPVPQVERGQESHHQLVGAGGRGRRRAPGSPSQRRNPSRTWSARAKARSHLSSTASAASSNASSWPSRPRRRARPGASAR